MNPNLDTNLIHFDDELGEADSSKSIKNTMVLFDFEGSSNDKIKDKDIEKR